MSKPFTVLVCFFLMGVRLVGQEVPRRSPHNGSLYQTLNYADSYFYWLNVGGWVGKNGSIPGFELDYTVESVYYSGCTSYTTLPQPNYDDCVTAGYDEDDPGKISFGVGTYDARQIQAGVNYFAQWSFWGGSQQASTYDVGWQEVWNFVNLGYGPRSPWYMDGVAAGVLMSYVTSKTVDQTRQWKWRDRWLWSGSANQEPDGTYYYSSKSQRHTGTLLGPSGTDFDLYLYYWNGSAWQRVASSTSYSSSETINYTGNPGHYMWKVQSYSGSGRYQFGIEYAQ